MSKKYHVALSYAGEQREYVAKVADALKASGVRVFYAGFVDEQIRLWGENLTKVLQAVYGGEESHCVVLFASREYVEKTYPKLELRHILARAIQESRVYALEARFDDVELSGLPSTTAYVDLRNKTPEELSAMIVAKLSQLGIHLASDGAVGEDGSPLSEEAERLLRAAERGDTVAQNNLGISYAVGLGVPQDHVEAEKWWRRAAEQGHADAQYNLGVMYDNGNGVPQDDAEAVKWWRRAAEQGHANAQCNLGVMYANREGVPKDDGGAVRWYRLAAEQGHADAQCNLGMMYASGRGVPQDDAEAVKWWRRAAEQGHADAQCNLGVMYAAGRGVPQDDAEAARWYRLAAEQGDASAQFNLGVMYANGESVPQDDAGAVKWWRRAAEQRHAAAQFNLGVMYASGRGVPRDDGKAADWYLRAAEQGQADAQYHLGALYYMGAGVLQNHVEAAKWLWRAAEQGDASAQYNLGAMYASGRGVPQDGAEAEKWWRRAAKRGHAAAKFNLSVMHTEGRGVRPDYTEAAEWYRRAAEQADAESTLGTTHPAGPGVQKLHIKNIGKLIDAELDIGRFTVLAGPNNTGKSTVSKVLYSVFDAMNVNPALVHLDRLTKPFFLALDNLESSGHGRMEGELQAARAGCGAISARLAEVPAGDFAALQQAAEGLSAKADEVGMLLSDTYSAALDQAAEGRGDGRELSVVNTPLLSNLDTMRETIAKLKVAFSGMDAQRFTALGIEHRVQENLLQTFQVPKLSDLRREAGAPSSIGIPGIGEFVFANGKIDFGVNLSGFRRLQAYSKVVYLESPIHWKLKKVLEAAREAGSRRDAAPGRIRIDGAPGYIYDLVGKLRNEYTGDMEFSEVFSMLTGAKAIGGKLALSDLGDILFVEDGRSFTLPASATGVANLGMLALLIERKVLDSGTFLFIDEPEAHLHTAWQVVMAEALFALAKGGVNVVIATHSPDILKWLEVHVRKNPEDEPLVALNQLPDNKFDADEQDFADKIATIKHGLTKPFANLYVKGL